MIYVEPAPYILGHIREVRLAWHGHIDVMFLTTAKSQVWTVSVDDSGVTVLPAKTWAAMLAVGRRLGRGRYDVVHLAGWGHAVLTGALLCAVWKKIPVVVESDTQPRVDRRISKSLRYRSGPSPFVPLWRRIVKRLIYPLFFKLPARFLPGGTRQVAYLKGYGVDPSRLRLAKMTVDVEKIMRFANSFDAIQRSNALRKYKIPEQNVRFLYIGRLEPYKGILDLVKSFRSLCKARNDVSLIVVGDGTLRTHIVDAAAELACFHYLGRLDEKQIWEAYAVSDVVVVPSHLDNWGLVVNEAMAAGLPVIATSLVGCVDDLVRHGITGLVIRPGEPIELCAAMAKLASEAALRRQMGSAAQRLISDWTLANQAQITTSAWAEVIP